MCKINSNPRISVITVSFNSKLIIEETILSVINQTFTNIEYIIVDGGSTDGTIDVIKKYSDRISTWISEPDEGIFDAMNKAVTLCNGEWVYFLNCGDTFFSNFVLEEIFDQNSYDNISVIYGSVMAQTKIGDVCAYSSEISTIVKNLPFCHQGAFTRTDCLKKNQFDKSFKLCADYNFFYNLYIRGYSFLQIKQIIANYEAVNGVSTTQRSLLKKEICLITGRSMASINWEYFCRDMKFFVFQLLKKLSL